MVVLVVDVVVVVDSPGVFGVFSHPFSKKQRHTQKIRMRTPLIKISPLSRENLSLVYNKSYLFVNHISFSPIHRLKKRKASLFPYDRMGFAK